jgi:protoporphyrinogen oxidase
MSDDDEPQRWCVVGGGIMGLELAKRIAEANQRVTLLEAGNDIGGLASAWQLGSFTWDRHYHVTLLSDQHTRRMLKNLRLEHEMLWVETKTGFYTNGQLYSLSNNWEFLRFRPLNLLEKLRLGLTIFMASKIRNPYPLEKIPVADWLAKWSGAGTFRKIWLPLLKAKLGPAYERVSAAFIWATIARMYRARRTGLKKEMFGYLPGGYARILAALRQKLIEDLGVEIRCSSPIRRVEPAADGNLGVELVSGESLHFDKVVLTLPSAVIPTLCPTLTEDEKRAHAQIEYLGILCASVVLRRPLSHYYVTNITDSGIPFTAVIEMTALVDPQELGGHHLVYLPRYATQEDEAWQWSDEELRRRFLACLAKMYPHFTEEQVVDFRVSRVRHVMALPTLGYSGRLPDVVTSIPGLFVLNSAQITEGTLNVNEVLEIVEQADGKYPDFLPQEIWYDNRTTPTSPQVSHAGKPVT